MVSVVVCTYDNSSSLAETLASLAAVETPDELRWELVVVDNNSADDTRTVAERHLARFPTAARYVFEPRQGVAHARNRGIREARGELLFYLDDDVTVHPAWLRALHRCFLETRADAVGTRIERRWQCPRPYWCSDEIAGFLVEQDFGRERVHWTCARRFLVTASIGFRVEALRRHGGFRCDLGRRGRSLLGGEDAELYHRLRRSDHTIMYEPQAIAYHSVVPDRVTMDYARRWFYETGLTLGHLMERKRTHLLAAGAPIWLWMRAAGARVRRLKVHRRSVDERERFASEVWCRHFDAMLRERLIHWLPGSLAASACAFHRSATHPPPPGDGAAP